VKNGVHRRRIPVSRRHLSDVCFDRVYVILRDEVVLECHDSTPQCVRQAQPSQLWTLDDAQGLAACAITPHSVAPAHLLP
ncbi:uncharacterized protein METZ01_LOCUS137738, partial [marine metagenome]